MQHHLLSIFYCLLYGGCSFCFSLSVKYLWIKYNFRMTFMLLLYENCLTAIISVICGKRNHTSKHTILYSFFNVLQTVTGMKGLEMVNVSMYMTLRRTLILFVFFMQKDWKIVNSLSVIFITFGAIVAGQEHLEDKSIGYIYLTLNNIFNALALYEAKFLNKEKSFDALELQFQNACNQIPFLFIGAYISDEWHQFFNDTTLLYNQTFLIALTLVCLMGFLLSYSTNLCNMHNSPLAIAITHNVKDIIITSYAFLFLKEEYDFQILAGIILSYLGSILYSMQKIHEVNISYISIPQEDKDEEISP